MRERARQRLLRARNGIDNALIFWVLPALLPSGIFLYGAFSRGGWQLWLMAGGSLAALILGLVVLRRSFADLDAAERELEAQETRARRTR